MPTAKGFTRKNENQATAYTQVDDTLRVPSGSTFQVDDGATFTMNGAFAATAGETGKFIETGTYASAAESGIALSATNFRPVSFLFDDAGAELGAADYRAVLSRIYLSVDQTESASIRAIRGQVKAADGVDINYDDNAYFGAYNAVEGYLEFAGTTARTIGANTRAAAVHAFVELRGNHTITSGGRLAGVLAELGHDSKTITGDCAGVWVDIVDSDHSWAGVWPVGIKVADSASTTGIEVGASTTGISISGAVTTGISISDNATDGIKISGGTVVDAIEIGASTNGVNISGATTTGVLIAGAATTGVSITGNATDGVKISGGTVVDGVEIGASTNAINVSGAVTKGLLIAGNATDAIYIGGGTVVDGIEIGACTTALNISGAVTTGISVAGTSTTGISIAGAATTGLQIGDCSNYGILMEGTYTNAIRITTNVATTAQTSVRVLNTYTAASGYHTAVMGAAIYNPTAASGYGAVIGVYGEANIQGDFTGGTNWSFGVRGTLQLTDDTVINNASSIFGAINASMKDDATPTLTAGHVCGIYIENLIDADLSGISGITAMIYSANNSSATCTMDYGWYNYGPEVTYLMGLYDCTVNGCVVAASVGGSQDKKLKIDIDGTDYYIPCHTA